jgi:hypothetical protein
LPLKELVMKRNVLLSLVLFSATAVSAQEVTFGTAPQPATWSDSGVFESRIAAATLSVRRTKSVCVAGDALEVTYTDASEAAVIGKTYAVTPRAVTYPGGALPSQEEIAFVRRDNLSSGTFRALAPILAGRTIAVGSSIEPGAKDAAALMSGSSAMRIAKLVLTLRSVEDGVATFDVTMTAKAEQQAALTLTGTFEVRTADSRARRMEMNGDITAPRFTGHASMKTEYAF